MATPADQLDQLLATTFDAVKAQLSDQVTQEVALLAYLNMKAKVNGDGGNQIRRPVMHALNDTVSSYDGYDVIDTTPQSGFGYAVYDWKQYAGAITISGKEIRINSGVPQIINLLTAKVEQLRLSMEDDLNSMLFGDGTGNSSKDFLGLQAIVNNSGTLGGIDSSTETWWKSTVRTSAVDLTDIVGVADLNNTYNTLRFNKSKPDLELTTQANFEAFENLAAPQIRFTQTDMAKLDFESIAHKNSTVVMDLDTPAPAGSGGGYWYMLNSDHLEFVQHNQAWMNRLPFQQPYNQDAKVALVISMGNLITDMRRAHAVIKNVFVG